MKFIMIQIDGGDVSVSDVYEKGSEEEAEEDAAECEEFSGTPSIALTIPDAKKLVEDLQNALKEEL